MKKKSRKTFWHNIKFKYKLTIVNENTLEEVVAIHVSKLNGLSVLLSTCVVLFLIAAIIIVFTPLRNYLPGYMNSEVRSQVVSNALRADSMQEALARQSLYITNIQQILKGEIVVDSVYSIDSLVRTDMEMDALEKVSKEELAFRKSYEDKEQYNLTTVSTNLHDASGLIFYRPVRGIMSTNFNPDKKHFGVDLTASPNENVLAVLDGTVIAAFYTADWGYVIEVQHTQNFVSIYKQCGTLMKAEGDRVKGGDVIALVEAKTTNDDVQPHLHFELWHRGTPMNPEKYIVF